MRSCFIVLLLILFGCASTPQVSEQIFYGINSYGDDVDVVSLCGSSDIYWVWSNPEIQQTLNKDQMAQANQMFYIEFSGEFLNVQRDDLSAGYAGLVRINRVVNLVHSIPVDYQK